MTYIISYKVGSSEEIKLAQIEDENITKATKKVKDLFAELESIGNRKYRLVDITALNAIRKLDALD